MTGPFPLPEEPVTRAYVLLELASQALAQWMAEAERLIEEATYAREMVERATVMVEAAQRVYVTAKAQGEAEALEMDDLERAAE